MVETLARFLAASRATTVWFSQLPANRARIAFRSAACASCRRHMAKSRADCGEGKTARKIPL